MRIRRGADPDLIVRLADGAHAAIAMNWTDYGQTPSDTAPPGAAPLLALEGLRQMAQVVAQLRGVPSDPQRLHSEDGG